jgi:hypothetical protein
MELEKKLEYFKNKGYTYDKDNGTFKSPSGNIVHNIIAKFNDNSIKVKLYEFAWYYTYNEVPERIEHINGNKSDNRINNLLNIKDTLKCKKCGKELLKSKFSTYINKSNNKLYYKRACKKCLHESDEEYYTLDHEILLHYMTEEEIIKIEKLINNEKFTYNGIKLKRCSKCGMLKSDYEFNFVNINKQLRQSWCKLCGLNYQKNKNN